MLIENADVFFRDASQGWVLFAGGRSWQHGFLPPRNHGNLGADLGRLRRWKVPSEKPDELDGRSWMDFIDPLHGWMVLHARSSSAFSWGLLLVTDDGGLSWKELPQVPVAGRPVFYHCAGRMDRRTKLGRDL